MSKDIHPRVKIVINKAIKEAQTLDDIQVRPEHIIISILTDEENECKIFKELNVDIITLQDNLSEYLRVSDLIPKLWFQLKETILR
jgi:ATP-dependent Clp protease ATP-binding subunit ClpA